MQKSKNIRQLKYKILVSYASQIFILVAINFIAVSQNEEVINKVALIAPQFDVFRVIMVGSVLSTLLGYLINYNLLLVIFKIAGEEIDNSIVALLYFMSSILAVSLVSTLKFMWQVTYMQEVIIVNALYGVFLLIYTVIVLRKDAREQSREFHMPMRLLFLLLLYSIANIFVAFIGGNAYA